MRGENSAPSPSTNETHGSGSSTPLAMRAIVQDTSPTAPANPSQDRPRATLPGRRAHIGWVVAGSFAFGLLAALLLAAAPFIRADERALTGAVLCGFGLGWAMLALLSLRLTDQPQLWAFAPALVMGAGGLLLIAIGEPVRSPVDWVWPPAMLVLAIWIVVQARRHLRSRSRRWLLYPVVTVLALVAVGGAYETVNEAADVRAYPMPGELIDIGGRSLHLSCTGTGTPTVVAEPGGGEMSSNWAWITPAVAQDTRICVYDRAGQGWSEPADSAQDATQIAADLHALLDRANEPGPYVLAGHSFGGLYVLTFADLYPDEVAGMVLVDSTTPREQVGGTAPAGQETSYDVMGRASGLMSATARLGLIRMFNETTFGTLPASSRDEVRAKGATAASLGASLDEYVQANASAEAAAGLRDFADKPLFVLTADIGTAEGWSTTQARLATLSTNAAHRVVEGADHQAFIADKEGAAVTTSAILQVVSAVRNGTPLGE